MKKAQRILVSVAAASAIGALAPVASASADTGTSYGATLSSINGSGGSGMLSLSLDGTTATVTEHWSGLAAKFGVGRVVAGRIEFAEGHSSSRRFLVGCSPC